MIIILETFCGASQKIEVGVKEKLPQYMAIHSDDIKRYFTLFLNNDLEKVTPGIYLYRETTASELYSRIKSEQTTIWHYEKRGSSWTTKQNTLKLEKNAFAPSVPYSILISDHIKDNIDLPMSSFVNHKANQGQDT